MQPTRPHPCLESRLAALVDRPEHDYHFIAGRHESLLGLFAAHSESRLPPLIVDAQLQLDMTIVARILAVELKRRLEHQRDLAARLGDEQPDALVADGEVLGVVGTRNVVVVRVDLQFAAACRVADLVAQLAAETCRTLAHTAVVRVRVAAVLAG